MSTIFKYKYQLILLIIPLVLVVVWFHTGRVIGGGEEGIAFYNPVKTLRLSQTMWWEMDGGFATLAWLAKIPSQYLFAFLYEQAHLPSFLIQAIAYFVILLTGIFSVYLLVREVFKDYEYKQQVSLIAALFYLFNPYSFSQIWGRGLYSQIVAFAMLPLGLYLFIKGLQEKKFSYILFFCAASFIFSSAFAVTTFIVSFWSVLVVTVLFEILINRTKKNILFCLSFFTLTLIIWILTNLWWFIPLIFSGSKIYFGLLEGSRENLETLMGLSQQFTPDLLIRLLQRFIFFSGNYLTPTFSSVFFQLISWLIPISLLIGFIQSFKNKQLKKLKLFCFIFLLGFFVSSGVNLPFGAIFLFFFKQISFLQSFRNPYEKFGLVLALSYSFLFALGMITFVQSLKTSKYLRRLILYVVLILILGIYSWPMWTGAIFYGPQGSLGVEVPEYYKELDSWLKQPSTEGLRALMLPLWSGDGSAYKWGNTTYYGLDPMFYILDTPTISGDPQFPYYYDLLKSMLKNINNTDLFPATQLLRTKYLIIRNDALYDSELQKQQEKNLTEKIYPPVGIEQSKPLCQNLSSASWLICNLDKENQDWSGVKYLHVSVKTPVNSTLELAIRDNKGVRPRWDGRTDKEYQLEADSWTDLTLPISAPSEGGNIDFSKISSVEVQAHPLDSSSTYVGKIELKSIFLDKGKEKNIDHYKYIRDFGKLKVYQPKTFSLPPQIGLLNSIQLVKDFPELFIKIDGQNLENTGFLLTSQNGNKNLDALINNDAQILAAEKISDTKYYINLENNAPANIILSENFHPQWKVIPGAKREQLDGGFLNNLNLLKMSQLSEDNHFVANGYANLWKVGSSNSDNVIIFLPQIYTELGSDLSKVTVSLLLVSISLKFLLNFFWTIKDR